MRYFFGCTFMNREQLAGVGVKYPIKLEYYKTITNEDDVRSKKKIKYGIEVVKTSYIGEKVEIETKEIPEIIKDEIETKEIPEIIKDEIEINKILDKFKQNEVTPVSAEYIIEDFLKESC